MDEKAAAQVHHDALVIDTHNDSLVAHIRRGNQSVCDPSRHTGAQGTVGYLRGPLDREAREQEVQLNIPKMRQAGIDAAFYAVDVTRARKNHLTYALDAFGFLLTDIESTNDDVVIALSADDIRIAKASGKPAIVLAVENSDGVEGSLNVLRMLYELGVRSLGLTHNPNSWAAAGNAEERGGGGLTTFGVDLVKEMNRLGMVVDVSHINKRGFWDVIETVDRPILASHSCCDAVCEHPRNLTDDQIKALAETGGSMGVTFVPDFVDASAPTLERLLDHVDHAVQLVGADYVGIGSDFDGGGTLVEDAMGFLEITTGLAKRGYAEEDLRKILGGNHLRVFEEATG